RLTRPRAGRMRSPAERGIAPAPESRCEHRRSAGAPCAAWCGSGTSPRKARCPTQPGSRASTGRPSSAGWARTAGEGSETGQPALQLVEVRTRLVGVGGEARGIVRRLHLSHRVAREQKARELEHLDLAPEEPVPPRLELKGRLG